MSNLIITTDTSLYNYSSYSSSSLFPFSPDTAVELLDLDAEGFEPEISYEDIKSIFLYEKKDPLDFYKKRIRDAKNIYFIVTEECLRHDGLLYGFLNRVFSLDLVYRSSESSLKQSFSDKQVHIQICLCNSRQEGLDNFKAFFKIQGFASCVEILEAAKIPYTFSTCKSASVECGYMISA